MWPSIIYGGNNRRCKRPKRRFIQNEDTQQTYDKIRRAIGEIIIGRMNATRA